MFAPSIRFPILALAVVGSLVLLYAAQVAVRHVHAQGDAAPTCATGTAVPDEANNPGLVSDCEALLASRDTLAGTATLNWSADTPISDWEGVTVEGPPQRVTRIDLRDKGLAGTIPAELGRLASLQGLDLASNQLSGPIPTELGNLPNLQWLFLWGNRLSGPIPSELGSLVKLEYLWLNNNQLTGPLQSELGRLANLVKLHLSSNQLTREIPTELGSLLNLRELDLSENQLTGPIPVELGSLSNLRELKLNGNELSGPRYRPNWVTCLTCKPCGSRRTG